MILSVSRRTDIPSYYSEWFFNRIKEGYLYVKNPLNVHQVSKIKITPDVVDCIVFWTKNPKPMMGRLDELKDYSFYFQFTLTCYGKDVEENVPHKKEIMIPVFQELSKKIGGKRVIWRYDPILFNDIYTKEYHLKAFEYIAKVLKGYTEKCVISFVDDYVKISKNMESLKIRQLPGTELMEFAKELSRIARENGMQIASCAENIDLEECGIEHNSCIDKKLVEEIIGCKIKATKDKNQRRECGCVESMEVGTYNTCLNGCKYCYANYSKESVVKYFHSYNVNSPILCGQLMEGDKVTERAVKSIREEQISLWDM